MRQYTTISLPKDLVEKIKPVIESGEFLNTPDFIRNAIRQCLEKYRGVGQ